LDLQDPRDANTGNLLPRRATHHGMLGLDTTVDEWSLGVELQASAMRFDTAANTTVLPGYVLLNLNGERQVAKDWTLLLRLDNATDAVYQLANGYSTAGRTLYAGIRWAP
jgi:vitamin B12 transporter